jgi:tRNA dimethylallyltransferase
MLSAKLTDDKQTTLSHRKLPLVVIVGPTAVGKTEVAIRLAEHLGGEIISADSRLFYRGLDIGTAKPSLDQRRRIPHHLIDVVNPDEAWSLAIYQRAARQAIKQVHSRQHLPFLVGGTGQYIKAVIQGWNIPKVEPDPRLRQVLDKWAAQIGVYELHARLALIDPQAASQIDYRNLRRTVRALEVIFTTGRRFSDQRQAAGETPYEFFILGLSRPRDELYARIDERIEVMLGAGLIDEVRSLLAQGYAPDQPSLSAIGYREIVAYLQGKMSLEEAAAIMKRRTRNFVRRQANWFKTTDPGIHWFRMGQQTTGDIEMAIRSWLQGIDDLSQDSQ